MKKKIEELKNIISEKLKRVNDINALQELEVKYLGRKGEFTNILRGLKNLNQEQKREIGSLANHIKKELLNEFEKVKEKLQENSKNNKVIDITLPARKLKQGHLNPLTLLIDELEDLFSSMGFMILDGPELESDYFCFESLNLPPYHPARDMQDTFYIDKKNNQGEYDMVMRTQTSPVQVRAMLEYGAPIKCVVPGRVFRSEATDACHDHTFHQIEGLMVDKNISIANFLAVVREMLSGIFKQDVKVRIRPGYFPFVEPGFELDMSCTICGGKSCASCKYTGWLEMGGAGMVHPNVLRAGNVDPEEYSGFAFGFGIERFVMMKYGIDDLRLLHSGDLRFLNQF